MLKYLKATSIFYLGFCSLICQYQSIKERVKKLENSQVASGWGTCSRYTPDRQLQSVGCRDAVGPLSHIKKASNSPVLPATLTSTPRTLHGCQWHLVGIWFTRLPSVFLALLHNWNCIHFVKLSGVISEKNDAQIIKKCKNIQKNIYILKKGKIVAENWDKSALWYTKCFETIT